MKLGDEVLVKGIVKVIREEMIEGKPVRAVEVRFEKAEIFANTLLIREENI
jgi:hypothetical protein